MIQYEMEENELIDSFLKLENPTAEELTAFLKTNLVHPGLYADFGRQVVTNLVAITHAYFEGLSIDDKRHFLKVLIKLVLVSFSLKRWAFNLSRPDALKTYEKAHLFFVWITNLIEPLETVRRELAAIDPELVMKRLLLVEGASEVSFIESIQRSTELLNFDFDVWSYDGKGNINNLILLIQEKTRQGIRVHLVYDSDRQSASFEDKLRKRCKVEAFFSFSRDFESAFPPALLTAAVNAYIREHTKLQVEIEETKVKGLLGERLPFVEALKRSLGIDISKRKLGSILGELTWYDGSLWSQATHEAEIGSEIAKFLRFVMLW